MIITPYLFPRRCLVCSEGSGEAKLCKFCSPSVIKSAQRCPLCFAWTGSEQPCFQCHTHPLPCNALRYLWDYHAQAKNLIRKMKYQGSYLIALLCAQQARQHIHEAFETKDWSLIVNIPSHPSNLSMRLFDVSSLVARALSKDLMIPYRDVIRHQNSSKVQASLQSAQRLRNAAKSFQITSGNYLQQQKILLVDDVVTTGSSVAIIASSLKSLGATRVDVFCLARSPHFQEYRAMFLGGKRKIN